MNIDVDKILETGAKVVDSAKKTAGELAQKGKKQVDLLDALFEMTSAFSTAGLSTGISSDLHLPAKILSIMIMFTGRLGPLTIASLWYFSRGELALYPDGNIVVG